MSREKSLWEKLSISLPIITSLATCYLTYQIGDNQNKISKLEFAPIFILKKSLEYDEKSKTYHTERLTISNEGYPIQNFERDVKTFLLLKKTTNTDSIEVLIPIIYFWVGYKANGGKGILSEMYGKDNNTNEFNLSNQVTELNKKNKDEIISMKIISTVKISYVEADGERKESYYKNEQLTTKDEVMKLENETLKKSKIDIENIKIDDLLILKN